mgnify:CR=1 FL=1
MSLGISARVLSAYGAEREPRGPSVLKISRFLNQKYNIRQNWENLGKLGKLRKLQMNYLIHNLVIHEWGCFLGGGSCQAATYPNVGVHPRPPEMHITLSMQLFLRAITVEIRALVVYMSAKSCA